MKRFREIIAAARKQYPKDTFFDGFEENCRNIKLARRTYRAYDKALSALDNESWQILKEKAVSHYMDHRPGQTKQGLFHQLNEAFAYRYLVGKGFGNVRFIREGRGRSPDIRFDDPDQRTYYCEVKTLGISDDEIIRRSSGRVYDGLVYFRLSEGFLRKFYAAVDVGRQQIRAHGADGLVYIMITFDDIALDFYRGYRMQLIKSLQTQGSGNLFIKFGVLGNKRISRTDW